ncbi:MAG TPA: amino acid adenylation domain-containing protein, partial [Longimicrobium sp.]|nr:amino acid adenylation domain-containing protein [Longimicrobium sp.]
MNRKNVEDLYPLSPLQAGMLFHTLYSPGTGAYLEQYGMNLQGSVNVDAFRAAWQRVVDRHPVLRTGFVWEGVPQPLQVVFRQVELPFSFEDWSGVDAAEQERRYQRELERERHAGLNLVKAPLMHVRLYRLGPAEWRFGLTTHHLLLDGWSLPIVMSEFGAFYAGLLEGATPTLPARRPFREYITWLNKQDAGAAEAFWRARLDGFTAPTPLPLDRAPQRAGTHAEQHATAEISLTAQETEAIEAAARRLRVTANGLFQCAWARVLAAYTGEADVVFGSTVSGRPPELPGVDAMVGMFINAIPVRITVPADASVAEWARDVHAAQAEARAFEHAPLASVRAWSALPGDAPLFETLLVYENYPLDTLQSGAGDALEAAPDDGADDGFRVTGGHSDERTNYALSIVVAPAGEHFRVSATYDVTRLRGEDADTLLRGLAHVLAGIVANAEQPASALSLLSRDEVERVVRSFNRTDAEYPRHASIPALFEALAAARADAPAVVSDGVRWTYAEVDSRANRLARRLRELGVKVESRVGVAMERSPELIVALLGILKAGGAYVPLDPIYPAARRARMAADAGVGLVLTHGGAGDDWGDGIRQVDLAAERERIDALSSDIVDTNVDPGNLAHVLFTSGSTGVPKGVAIPHRAVVRLARGLADAGFRADDVFLQIAPVAFDASTLEVWVALLNGGAVAVHGPSAYTPAELGAFVQRHGVTTMWLTAGLFNQVVDAGAPGFARVRQIMTGGEVVSAAHVKRAMEALPSTRFVNGYGPTENTVFTTCHPIIRDDVESVSIPIGPPVANTRAYVLDEAMRPVPVGAPGEVYAGGDGLARGYAGRPGLTAERFIPDPFGDGGRLYRTGDRARWNEQGELEFVSRADRQVKVRGFRIEPGEIEAALVAHPSVRAAVVEARDDAAGGKRLVAYAVAAGDAGADAAELRAHLSGTLPDYMVPGAIVILPELPLTPNGKVDRARLPDPADAASPDTFVPPEGAAEEALADIWREVLKVEAVGAHDSFFLLGGHSLLATQVVSRVRAAFGIELPLREIFEHPTLERLATVVEDLL